MMRALGNAYRFPFVPAASNTHKIQYAPGCNEPSRLFYFDKQIGFYREGTILQLYHIDFKPCSFFEELIKKRRIDRLNKHTTQDEFGRILNCLKRIRRYIPLCIQELIF